MLDHLASTDFDITLLNAMIDIGIISKRKTADLTNIRRVADILETWMETETDVELELSGLAEILSEISNVAVTTIDDLRIALRQEIKLLKNIDMETDVARLGRSKRFCVLFHRAYIAEIAAISGKHHLAA